MNYFIQRLRGTVREYAQGYPLYQIINLNFEPRQKTSDMEISKELNISRAPVWEAIPSLINGQLIESYPQCGIFVSLINSETIEQVCTMRRMIEGPLAEMNCGLISQSNLNNLYDTITPQKDHTSGGPRENFEKFLPLDIVFRKEFYNTCSMPFIYDTMQNVMPHSDRQRKLGYHTATSNCVISKYLVICKVPENRDAKEAGRTMVEHMPTTPVDQNISKKKLLDYFLQETNIYQYRDQDQDCGQHNDSYAKNLPAYMPVQHLCLGRLLISNISNSSNSSIQYITFP